MNGPYARSSCRRESTSSPMKSKHPQAGNWADQTQNQPSLFDCRPNRRPMPTPQTNRPDSDTGPRKRTDQIQIQERKGSQRSRDREHANAHTVLKLSQTHKGAQKDIAGGRWKAPSFPHHPKGQDFGVPFSVDLDLKVSMILPQVHLRKPCYDFSFL